MNGVEANTMNEVKFSLRFMIDKQKEKVLFAEVDSDFADTLISFLTLPLGTIIRILVNKYGDEAPVIGSLNVLYKSLENLDLSNFWTEGGKLMLQNPRNSFEDHIRKLKINIDDSAVTEYLTCANNYCLNVSMYYSTKCTCSMMSQINKNIKYVPEKQKEIGPGAFTTATASFLLTDDLQLLPNLFESGFQFLRNNVIEGTSDVEEKTLLVGFDELLKLSFVSSTPLTDFFFHKKAQIVPLANNCGLSTVRGTHANTSTSASIKVKLIIQKSTGKVVLAQTREDFIDFLFSLLSIPLGQAFSLLEGELSFGSIINLYKSVQSLTGDVHGLKIDNTFKTCLHPPMYLSKHQLFPLAQQQIPTPLYCMYICEKGAFTVYRKACLSPNKLESPLYDKKKKDIVSFVDPKGCEGSYIKGPTYFMVTDDLLVKPMSTLSGFFVLNSRKLSLSDVEERIVDIGIDEARSILKASLLSTSFLNEFLNFKLQLDTSKRRKTGVKTEMT